MEGTTAVDGMNYEKAEVGAVPGWWCRPNDAAAGAAILYLHGGAYVVGSARAYQHFVVQVASRAKAAAFNLASFPSYRRCNPEESLEQRCRGSSRLGIVPGWLGMRSVFPGLLETALEATSPKGSSYATNAGTVAWRKSLTDTVLFQLGARRKAEPEKRAFRRRVNAVLRNGHERSPGIDVHDASAALSAHQRNHSLHRDNRPQHVEVEDFVKKRGVESPTEAA